MVRKTHPTLIFMVLGVPLEHEWLVPKRELGPAKPPPPACLKKTIMFSGAAMAL
jgi:hypothetical protein